DSGDGVLVLTDAFGSTPSNIAMRLSRQSGVTVVSGLNLPMLLRVMNYPQLSLEELQINNALPGGVYYITIQVGDITKQYKVLKLE
ncbi:MAG: hypothetical protein KY428_11955, partial [Bacteroidetes bacterium]|nr:hypothetical protein [Bacteroidota bacterium]